MALYGLIAVNLDAHGKICRARIQHADGARNAWIGEPRECEAHEIANMIATGDEIYSIFIVPNGTVLGPIFRRTVLADGREGIELEIDVEGRRLRDLILF